jgi:hypothetical protein
MLFQRMCKSLLRNAGVVVVPEVHAATAVLEVAEAEALLHAAPLPSSRELHFLLLLEQVVQMV